MKKTPLLFTASVLFLFLFQAVKAQEQTTVKTTISASLRNSITNEVIPFATVFVKDRPEKAISDNKGNISFGVAAGFPVTLIVSSVGYETRELLLSKGSEHLTITLTPSATIHEEVVVLPTGTASNAMLAPVTVERMNLKTIVHAAAPNL